MGNLKEAIKTLQSGRIIIHNTDTCIGMAVNICDEKAVKLLYNIKKMDISKPVSILCSNLKMAREYGVFSKEALKLAKKHLPGGLTLIVPRSDKLPKWINPQLDCVGIRIPDHQTSLNMVKMLGCPITTTSCNISGESVCKNKKEVLKVFTPYIRDIYIYLDSSTSKLVSTIIKIEDDNVVLVRKGLVNLLEE